MRCIECDGIKFTIKEVPFYTNVKGVEIEVNSEAIQCNTCGHNYMDTGQMEELIKKIRKIKERNNV